MIKYQLWLEGPFIKSSSNPKVAMDMDLILNLETEALPRKGEKINISREYLEARLRGNSLTPRNPNTLDDNCEFTVSNVYYNLERECNQVIVTANYNQGFSGD